MRRRAGRGAEAAPGRAALGALLVAADPRLRPAPDAPALPLGCDWVWRPAPWLVPVEALIAPGTGAAFAPGVTLFHDGPAAAFDLHQIRAEGPAPFALCLEARRFEGGFVSLSIALPPGGLAGLRRGHIVQALLRTGPERPAKLFCRLNLRHGPNTEQMLRSVPESGVVAFDLAYTQMNEKRLEKAWLDVIVEAPRMTTLTLRDLVLLRHPRADI